MPIGAGMPRAPHVILVVEAQPDVVPARITGMPVGNSIRAVTFVVGVGKATDHHHRCTRGPRKPRQAARHADKECRVAQPADPLGQRTVSGLVLRAVGDVGPNETLAVLGLLIDADER